MNIILIVMLVFLLFSVLKSVIGPTFWDRMLGMNLISTKVVLIIIIFASSLGLEYLLDFAIIYALTGFICTIFISSFIAERIKAKKNEGEEDKK
ncbi:MAG: monovalent cation/H+ antiporter complex subunit F [Defluviitaleaceae bacterium]|nr:monovalent cation/H+ antiporter complex subunit F [Defluviitaleaceae bacterium]